VDEARVRCIPCGRPRGLRVALAIPEVRVSTEAARTVLPSRYTREDAVFSASRAAFLVAALTRGASEELAEAVRDRIHTPARAALVPAWQAVRSAGYAAGAAGVFISGSGPTVGAFVAGRASDGERVARAMAGAFADAGVEARPRWPTVDAAGVDVEVLSA
jgi:homoserine kinase